MYVCVWQGAPRCIYSQDMLSPPQRVCAYFPRDLLLLLPTMMGSCLFITSSFTPVCVFTYIMLVISILIKYRRRERDKESCCCYSRPWLALDVEYNPYSLRCVCMHIYIHDICIYIYIIREREREREPCCCYKRPWWCLASASYPRSLRYWHACVCERVTERVCVCVCWCMYDIYVYILLKFMDICV